MVADLSEMEALVNVDENDIVSVELGQQAQVQVDALFGEILHGTVYEIANAANTNEQGSTNQKTEFEVTLAIESSKEELRPGMTASADIITATRDSALSIPIQTYLMGAEQIELRFDEARKADYVRLLTDCGKAVSEALGCPAGIAEPAS